jgi:hypothetical protein
MELDIRRFNSSAILWAGYDSTQELLVICFTSNHHMEYDYPRVPEHIWRGLLSARSKGQYYNDHIRDTYGVHRTERRSLRRWP